MEIKIGCLVRYIVSTLRRMFPAAAANYKPMSITIRGNQSTSVVGEVDESSTKLDEYEPS